jgi:hypothetical protein
LVLKKQLEITSFTETSVPEAMSCKSGGGMMMMIMGSKMHHFYGRGQLLGETCVI